MKLGRWGVLSGIAFVSMLACGNSEPSASPAPASDAGASGGPPAPVPPPVGGQAPEGIFVSASKGLDGADGAKTRPVKTIAAAIALAVTKRLPILVCPESYAESVTLADGISMFGYYDCTNLESWVRVDAKAVITSPTSPSVMANGLALNTRFEGFDVVGPSFTQKVTAPTPAQTSYAMIVKKTKNLTIANVKITGGTGQDGADGAEPTEGNAELVPGNAQGSDAPYQHLCTVSQFNFCDANSIPGAAGGVSKCKVGPNGKSGGQGGDGPVSSNSAYRVQISAQAAKGKPIGPGGDAAEGGTPALPGFNPGSEGALGGAGTNGAHGAWSFTVDGYVPGDGTAGGNGLPGQGGGGGAGTQAVWNGQSSPNPPPTPTIYGLAGAGGGAGGCGGLAGIGGFGGGASIGLFMTESEIAIDKSQISGGKGGAAGKGALGTLGTSGFDGGRGPWGGTADVRPQQTYGGAGGKGGDGGPAGLSGHGAPGLAAGIVVSGKAPTTTDVDVTGGAAGAGFPVTTRGSQSLPAVTGESKPVHAF